MVYIVVSKKKIRLAVDRNRAKRRVRAALKEMKSDRHQEFNGKVFVEPDFLKLPFPQLVQHLKKLFKI